MRSARQRRIRTRKAPGPRRSRRDAIRRTHAARRVIAGVAESDARVWLDSQPTAACATTTTEARRMDEQVAAGVADDDDPRWQVLLAQHDLLNAAAVLAWNALIE